MNETIPEKAAAFFKGYILGYKFMESQAIV
jgi:hypothetical protein